jgi:ring-1,2-phenylacetyl-CoA epoxidase subunit PaaB
VADTRDVFVSPMTENDQNAYDLIEEGVSSGEKEDFEIFHLLKRGKQHIHAGTVSANGLSPAMMKAKEELKDGKMVYNIWAIPAKRIRFTTAEDHDLWLTLSEKKFRDAASYKGGDKLKDFLEKKTGL